MFYDNFCKICASKGLKPTNVVNDLKLSSGNMTNWKNGRTPKTQVINRIADYLQVSIDELLGNEINKEITDDDIKFALWGGDSQEVDQDMYEDVKAYAEMRMKLKKKKSDDNKK